MDPQQFRVLKWPENVRPHTFLYHKATDARRYCDWHLLTGSFGRDDYRELCKLIIKYLGGDVIRPHCRPNEQNDDFVMRAPGALHHARLLASSLYILKLTMLANVTPSGLLTPNMIVALDRIAEYIALFHGPWYLQARLPAPSPRLDLQLWQDMCIYQTMHGAIVEIVKTLILCHH